MNFARIRWQLTALYTMASAVAVLVLCVMAVRAGSGRLADSATRALEEELTALSAGHSIDNPVRDQSDAWYVDTHTSRIVPAGPTQLEPPLLTVAKEAADSRAQVTEKVTLSGDRVELVARPVPGTSVVVVVAGFQGETRRAQHSLTIRVGALSAGLLLASAVVGWFLAGRSLGPARLAVTRQRELLANAAHEIRTPLAVIQASASQALARPRSAEDYVRALAEIRGAAERAGTGVGEMLDLARLEAGQAAPRLAPLRLDLLAEEIASTVPPLGSAGQPNATVTVNADHPVVVNADATLMRQAISNIVLNAVGHSANVQVNVSREDRRATVEVCDDGPGIPVDMLDGLFERFHRGDAGGNGLGLAIVRSIVEIHGGRVDAANAPGGGAIVSIRLTAIEA